MTTSRVSPRARRRLQGAAAIFCVFFMASCRAILGTDDYQSSVNVLCDLLARCFDDDLTACQSAVADEINGALPEERETWLQTFSSRGCYERCASARRCLNIPPLCGLDECSRREDCCGFVEGQTDCAPGTGFCCSRRGARCESTNGVDTCCDGAGKCIGGVCGGVPCGDFKEPCSIGEQCCTGVCKDGACAEDICFDDGFECDSHEDCCNDFCDPARDKCGVAPCGAESATCIDGACCEGLICLGDTCSQTTCFSNGVECGGSFQCCSGRCDPILDKCLSCKEGLAPCDVSGECCSGNCKDNLCVDCLRAGEMCTAGGKACCSGDCNGGTCPSACVDVGCPHTACVAGAPLKGTCDPCAALVCAQDKYCCCGEWDSVCVKEALNLCENPCQ